MYIPVKKENRNDRKRENENVKEKERIRKKIEIFEFDHDQDIHFCGLVRVFVSMAPVLLLHKLSLSMSHSNVVIFLLTKQNKKNKLQIRKKHDKLNISDFNQVVHMNFFIDYSI